MRTPMDYPLGVNPLEAVPAVRYDTATGAITEAGTMQRIVFDLLTIDQGEPYLQATGDIDSHYVDLATKAVMPKQAGAAVLNGQRLTNLPQPATIDIEGQIYTVTDGVADLTFDEPGTYTVTVRAVRFLDQIFQVTA